VKATPKLTADVSPESTVAGVDEPKIVHGQAGVDASGVAGSDAVEGGLDPDELVAVTVKVYVVPLVSVVIVFEVGGGLPVTVNWVCAVVPT
jgi:hypothetical protein